MIVIGFILTIIALFGLFFCLISDTHSKWIDNVVGCICIVGVLILITGVLVKINKPNQPTALDVYQGKTTLEITYRDSIFIDSVVVFKDEFKK